jgi:hypothetical protein
MGQTWDRVHPFKDEDAKYIEWIGGENEQDKQHFCHLPFFIAYLLVVICSNVTSIPTVMTQLAINLPVLERGV